MMEREKVWVVTVLMGLGHLRAAWDGFLKARKLGTFKIERLIRTGEFREGDSPLER